MGHVMTVDELVDRIRARGGQLRAEGARLQYRPAGVLSSAEVVWLGLHRDDVLAALARSGQRHQTGPADQQEEDVWRDHKPMGEAGPGVPAWHCSIDGGTGHVRSPRVDGSTFCSTCHPNALARRGVRPT